MINTFEQAVAQSTCQKRITICEIYDIEYNLLSRESNRCEPDNGVCSRFDVKQNKDNYDTESNCNWTHAEIRAIQSLPSNSKPYLSILYGHNFYCDACEQALKDAGVQIFEINHLENPNHSPELKDLLRFFSDNGWSPRWGRANEWRYERSYADMIYDELWIDGDKVRVTYTDVQWGYTNYENHEFTYEEFKEWHKCTYGF